MKIGRRFPVLSQRGQLPRQRRERRCGRPASRAGGGKAARLMTEQPPASILLYNERVQSRMSVCGRWMVLVPACAIPLVIAGWRSVSAYELVGIGAGIATWTVVMIRFHVWRLTSGEYGETTRLTLSAAVL